jgi:hypothetical protein
MRRMRAAVLPSCGFAVNGSTATLQNGSTGDGRSPSLNREENG